MASVRKIAERAGVSIATVSRVLNNDPGVTTDTRDRVLLAANRSGYVPSVGRRATSFVAFAYTSRRTLANAFDAAVLEGVTRGLDESRMDVVLIDLQRDKQPEETYTQFFLRRGVRGVVLRTVAETRDVCGRIASEGFPHVVVSDRFDDSDVNYIDADSRAESRRAVEYLIALGHRRIALAMHNVPDRDHNDRFEGYKEALAGHGIAYDDRLVLRCPTTLVAGATVMKLLFSFPDRPTAVFCTDPALSVGAIQHAHEIGVCVPDDLSVIGFDDSDVRLSVHPVMTAVCQNAERLGYQAGTWIGRAVQGEAPSRFQSTIPTHLEINQSTAPPGGARVRGTGVGLVNSSGGSDTAATNGFGERSANGEV